MDDVRAVLHSAVRRETGDARLLRAAARGAPATARAPRLDAKMHADEALRCILDECLTQVAANAGVVRTHRSVEGLHQLRVALRRLEVTLSAFGHALKQQWFEELRGRVKAVAAQLSPARDLDVFVETLLADAARAQGDTIAPLRRAADAARDLAWNEAQAAVADENFTHLLDDIAALARSRLPIGGEERVGHAARRILKHAAKRVAKRGKAAKNRSDGDLHRLRIALKKLRYLSEFFAPLYGRKALKPYLKSLKNLQQELGHLNDIAHVRSIVGTLLRDESLAVVGYGGGLMTGYYGAGRARRAKKALRRFGAFNDLKPFWKNRD